MKNRDIIPYEDWKKAVDNPDSKESIDIKEKAKDIVRFGEVYFNMLSDAKKQECLDFNEKFSLDITKILPQNDMKKAKEILDFAFPAYLLTRLEIEKTYGMMINHKEPEIGEKILIYLHFKNEGRYIKEKGKQPDYKIKLF